MADKKLILVTGASGYIASRLIPKLLDKGYRVRCMVRHPHRIQTRAWFRQVEVVQADVMVPSTLPRAMEGVHTAYYLIHNMASGSGYTSRESCGAENFANAAAQAGLQHVIYLGGLADPKKQVSSHMRSRMHTGERLRTGTVPVTEFRAGVIVGPGSISFEMIRFMTELMVVIFGPIWLQNRAQPIAAQNVIDYLLAALEKPAKHNQIFEIGGPDVMSYADLMLTYGRLRGLWRKYVIVPGIPVWFMALGVEWMTPVPAVIAKPLVGGMRGESVANDPSAQEMFPGVRLIGYEEAVMHSLSQLHPTRIEPVWRNSKKRVQVFKHEGFFIDHRWARVEAASEKVFSILASMGGKAGWPYANWLWKLRGWLDRLLSGPGMRGRKRALTANDMLDFYRVEAIEENRSLLLRSELKVPGDGWMEWRVEIEDGKTRLSQTGYFAPRGFLGFVYWFALAPFHKLIFRGMLKSLVRLSEL
ncbi:MAG: SDR family oxidoreductase [Anaerolineales bacterium]